MQYEAVFYQIGNSLYHVVGDSTELRPNAQEEKRVQFNFYGVMETPPTCAYVLIERKTGELISPFFQSMHDSIVWRRRNNMSVDSIYYKDFINNDQYIGPR